MAVVARAWRVGRGLPRRSTINHPFTIEAFAIEIEAFAIEETGNTEETGTGVAVSGQMT